MLGKKRLTMGLLCLIFGSPLFAAKTLPLQGGENVLLIGNSLSLNIDNQVNAIFTLNGIDTMNCYRVNIWNQSLKTHWEIDNLFSDFAKDQPDGYKIKGQSTLWKKGLYNTSTYLNKGYITALEAIKNGTPAGKPWDYVVLQDYEIERDEGNWNSDSTLKQTGDFYTYAKKLIDEIRKAGATPLFYEHFVLNPSMGGGTTGNFWKTSAVRCELYYRQMNALEDVPVIPVGEVMHDLCTTRKPENESEGWLYADNVHPKDPHGEMMRAYVFASVLSGRPAAQLNHPLKSQYTALCQLLQEATDAVVSNVPTCQLSLSATSHKFDSTGGSTSISVTSEESWQASTATPWLTIEPSATALTITAQANHDTSSRSAEISVVGCRSRTITITQEGVTDTTTPVQHTALSWEAEVFSATEGYVSATWPAGFSGQSAIKSSAAQAWVSYTVTVETTGQYGLRVQYLNGDATTDRPMTLTVNNEPLGTQPFSPTGAWVDTSWKEVTLGASFMLTNGSNTIKLQATGSKGPLLDKLSLFSQQTPISAQQLRSPTNHQLAVVSGARPSIEFSAPQGSSLDIALYSLKGQRITQLFSGRAALGLQRHTLTLPTLQAGHYIVQLRSEETTLTRTINLVR